MIRQYSFLVHLVVIKWRIIYYCFESHSLFITACFALSNTTSAPPPTPPHPGCQGGSCCSVIIFCVVFCRSLFVVLSLFLLVLHCHVLLLTASDYLFGVFKHVLHCLYSYKYPQIYLQPTCHFPTFQTIFVIC